MEPVQRVRSNVRDDSTRLNDLLEAVDELHKAGRDVAKASRAGEHVVSLAVQIRRERGDV